MDASQSKVSPDNQTQQKLFCKQPITCPWITTQPYPSTMNKNRSSDPTSAKTLPTIPLSVESKTINDKTCPSLQHSSSQFFYFLRLMQLFPETHPATLHTVLCLCKNDFFCAVDKLLYAKRCKALYNRSQGMLKRCSVNRSHPYCGYGGPGRPMGQQDKERYNEATANNSGKEISEVSKDVEKETIPVVKENNGLSHTNTSKNETNPVVTCAAATPNTEISNNQISADDVTSPGTLIKAQEIKCDDSNVNKSLETQKSLIE